MEKNIRMNNLNPKNKAHIRTYILEKRNQLSVKMRNNFSALISQKILSFDAYQKAKYILIFLSHVSEVDTEQIIEQAFRDGKEVYAPRIIDYAAGEMVFARIYSGCDFEVSEQGIREPKLSDEIYQEKKDTLCIVPGAAFDTNKNRIGYGKGFYDRFFESTACKKIAICFNLQIIEEDLPINKSDIPMDYIVSERRIL